MTPKSNQEDRLNSSAKMHKFDNISDITFTIKKFRPTMTKLTFIKNKKSKPI